MSNDPARLSATAARFRGWMFDQALPFWAREGRDAPGLGFHETLRLDGVSADSPFKRMRVQARQLYSYAHAAMMGWTGGLEVARAGYDFIIAHGWRSDGGWAKLLGPSGGVVDDTADLYDNAFVLFALAWYARASGSDEALARARRTLDWILASMGVAAHGGFENTIPVGVGHRRQNPHMHLLEALLALHATSPDPAVLELAGSIAGLFRRHFFKPSTSTLGEFFGRDWSPAPGDAGTLVEPGHHYEWVWLLQQYAARSGEDFALEQDALFRFAETHGRNPRTGFVVNALGQDGRVRDAASRLWMQTEELKAHLALGERDGHIDVPRIEAVVATLLNHYCDPCGGGTERIVPPGGWIDVFDAEGTPAVKVMPASSLYHIYVAFAELQRMAA
jgi:mannose/cellobiose epimerase-like protein (N-acyl-D-glucosamine 2-epimerase family)